MCLGYHEMRESLSLSPNIRTPSSLGRRILKPSCTFCYISPMMNSNIYRVYAYKWGPLAIALSRISRYQDGPVLTSMTAYT